MDFSQRSVLSVIDRELFKYEKTHLVYLRYLIEGTTFLKDLHGVGWPVVRIGVKSPGGNRYDLEVAEKQEDGTLIPRLYIQVKHQMGPKAKQIQLALDTAAKDDVPIHYLMLGFAGMEYAYADAFLLEGTLHPVSVMATPHIVEELRKLELTAGKEYKQTLQKYMVFLRQQWERVIGYYQQPGALKKGRQRLFYYSLYHAAQQPFEHPKELRLLQSTNTTGGNVVLRDLEGTMAAFVRGRSLELFQEYANGRLMIRADLARIPESDRNQVRDDLRDKLEQIPVKGGLRLTRGRGKANDQVILAELQHLDHQENTDLPTFATKEILEGRRLLKELAKELKDG